MLIFVFVCVCNVTCEKKENLDVDEALDVYKEEEGAVEVEVDNSKNVFNLK